VSEGAPFRILFVCTGNTCRSPLAEAIARRELEEKGLEGFQVASAGTHASADGRASSGSLEVARANGLDLEAFVSRPLTPELLDGADLILVMEPGHRSAVLGLSPQADTKTLLLGELAGEEGPHAAVPDPFGGTPEAYQRTYRRLEELIHAGLGRAVEMARRKEAER
jgi:protein-tyrosine-phosphatase